MINPQLFKNGPEFIASMKELILRYKAAIELNVSKTDYEYKRGMDCLLCNPLCVSGRPIPMNHKQAYDEIWRIADRNRKYPEESHRLSCKKIGCPWMVMVGMTCDDWSRENSSDHIMVYHSNDNKFKRQRIAQLRHWIIAYKKFMKETK
jgi:hypothetical protein